MQRQKGTFLLLQEGCLLYTGRKAGLFLRLGGSGINSLRFLRKKIPGGYPIAGWLLQKLCQYH